MPLTRSGPLRRIVIAAKFNVTVQIGWPKIQILRSARNVINGTGTYIAAFTTSTMEPKPTRYLNLYEYDLTATDFDIQIGDKLNISWYGNILQHDQIRFSLAYYNNSKSPATPMVSIIVGNCDSETDLNTLYCEDISTIASSVTISTNEKTIIITITVVFSLLLLIILLISLAVFTFVVKQRRKSASVNFIAPIEMSIQPQMLHNTLSEPIMDSNQAYSTQEVEHEAAVDCIEMDANQAYITHSEPKNEQGAGKKEYIENQCYFTDTLPTDPNVACGTVDGHGMDVDGTNTIPTNANMAYGTNTNTVPTDPNVAYGTHPPQTNDYEYVVLL